MIIFFFQYYTGPFRDGCFGLFKTTLSFKCSISELNTNKTYYNKKSQGTIRLSAAGAVFPAVNNLQSDSSEPPQQ